MANEIVVLDPVEVASSRTELALHPTVGVGPFMVRPEGIDWGDAEIAAYMAEAERGEIPVDFRLPNRKVTIPLMLQASGATTFNQAREQLQQKIGLFQREGGWAKRQMKDGRKLFLDIVKATLKMGGGFHQAQHDIDHEIDLVLEATPDFYGTEITLDQVSELTNPELVTVLKQAGADAVIKGDYPGRARVVVDELDADDQLGLLLAFRSRHFSAASTAALAYEAEALDPLDSAAIATLTGASGGGSNNVVQHTDLGTNWTPVLGTNIGGSSFMTHTGSYRVWARLRSPDGNAVKARFVYDVGDLALPEENDPWVFPGASNFYLADLGEIRLDRVPVGTHRWQGQVQAKGSVGGEDIQVDRIWFQPLDESAARLQVSAPAVDGLTDYSARDEFNQTVGALTGKTLPVGGTWAGAGDADDFTVETTGKTAQRTAVSDSAAGASAIHNGRLATVSSLSLTGTAVQADMKFDADGAGSTMRLGVLARYVDNFNFVAAFLVPGDSSSVQVAKEIAGTRTVLGQYDISTPAASAYRTIRFVVDAAGRWYVWFGPTGGSPALVLSGSDSDLATGGTLASGTAGLVDYWNGAGARTRNYDNFFVAAPTKDAILFANQSAEVRTEGVFREDASGAAYGKVVPVGDLPRIPPSGIESRKVELFLKHSRGDFHELPDSGIDDIRAQVFYRPSWLFVPAA